MVTFRTCPECNEKKEDSAFGHSRDGSLKKLCKSCIGKKISSARLPKVEPAPRVVRFDEVEFFDDEERVCLGASKPLPPIETTKKHTTLEEKGKVAIMELRVFHAALALAYERGLREGKSFPDMTITEVELPVLLDEALGVRI